MRMTNSPAIIRVFIAIHFVCSLFVFAGCSHQADSRDTIFLSSCLDDLTNINRLVYAPVGRAGMTSSFDRTGGNNDGSYSEGVAPDGRRLLADLKGPGCVRRIWLTGMPLDHKFYFYFDGERKPRFIKSLKELTGKGMSPFRPPLCNYPSGAGYSYLPIPYASRLVISSDNVNQGQPFFYHVNYESFPRDTKVVSINSLMVDALADKYMSVGKTWDENQSKKNLMDADNRTSVITLQPGEKMDLFAGKGPGIIEEILISSDFSRSGAISERNHLLRMLVLRIYWNESDYASVEVPFGDFFCNGVRSKSFNSIPVAVEKDSFVMRFPMPFERAVRLEIHNESKQQITFKGCLKATRLEKWSNTYRYFHSAWRQSSTSGSPHEILNFAGPGHYAGCYLVDIGMDGSWNILESDESIYLDSEVFPSIHGTGLEDYFNGGWYYNSGIYTMPFAGNLEKSAIRTTQFRFHVPDVISFNNNIRVNIEFGHGNFSRGYMSSVAYWYANNPCPVPYKLPNAAERCIPFDPLEKTSFLCEVFERERVGRFDEAIDLCREYAEKYPDSPEAAIMRLRILSYRELLEGWASVKGEFEKQKMSSPDEEVKKESSLMGWLHDSQSNAIIIAHINGPYKLYYDGKVVKEGDSPVSVDLVPVLFTHGQHVIGVEVQCVRSDPWMSLYFMNSNTNFWSDGSWEVSSNPLADWTNVGAAANGFSAVTVGGPFPWMRHFQFKPNAFVCSQYRQQLLYNEKGWQPGQKMFFRKQFEMPVFSRQVSGSK